MKNLVLAILVIIFALVTLDMGIETVKALLDLRIVAALFGVFLTCGGFLLTKACYKSL